MRAVLLSLLLSASTSIGGEPMCGTGPWNDLRVRGIHEQTRARIASQSIADPRAATLREGAFYVRNASATSRWPRAGGEG